MKNVSYLDGATGLVPDVSIICVTYNHQDYIQDALDSFLSQKTSLTYEIIVHDDASTDRTQCILKDYFRRYPSKIRLILQGENQYSKFGFHPLLFASKFAKSEILMLCEGDDYWLSQDKMQVQYEKLFEHESVDMVFHPTYELSMDGKKKISCRHSDEEWIFPVNKVIRRTGGFCPTASIMIRKSAVLSLPDDLVKTMPCTDAFLQIYGARKGGALFLPDIYSVYRLSSSSSVTSALMSSALDKRREFNELMASSYDYLKSVLPLSSRFVLSRMVRKYRHSKNRNLIE